MAQNALNNFIRRTQIIEICGDSSAQAVRTVPDKAQPRFYRPRGELLKVHSKQRNNPARHHIPLRSEIGRVLGMLNSFEVTIESKTSKRIIGFCQTPEVLVYLTR